MRAILVSLFILVLYSSYAQDIDIYKHQKNSNFQWPAIPREMSFEEFELLSTDLRMQDMLMAVVLPGHVHFKIKEKKTGYYLLGARSLGYAGWVYLSLTDESLTSILILDNTGLDKNISTGDIIIAYSSVLLMLGSYLYDWIHGKYLLDGKQNKIRYKYARKLSLNFSDIQIDRFHYPGLKLSLNF